MSTASTIAYHLRVHKAIDRNLMITILKKLDRCADINLQDYRYVGFGAAFLDDFKLLHLELGIRFMDCLEFDYQAFSRQKFNNPYRFVNLYLRSSSDYINSSDFKQEKNQFIWLDYTSPRDFKQQLLDIELLGEKVTELDVVKVTFNAKASSFVSSQHIKNCRPVNFSKIIEFLQLDPAYELYLPDHVVAVDILDDFSILLRAMAVRAINRGLSKAGQGLLFNHISSFTYEDGQLMTTMMGIICTKEKFKLILKESNLVRWEFYQPETTNEFIKSHHIRVPIMTVPERIKIDKFIPVKNVNKLSEKLSFYYGEDAEENIDLLRGYCKFYKYLPYYSKVTF